MSSATTTPSTGSRSPLRRPGGFRWWHAVAGLAVVALLATAAVLLVADDTDEADVVQPPASSAAPSVAPTSEPTGGPPAGVDRSTAVWPGAGTPGYAEPVGAARAFATGFLGFSSPVVGAFQQGDSRSGEVEVRPVADGPVTTVLLRRLSGEDSWSVLGATTDSIRVSSPEALAVITSPVTVRGEAWTFEGHVTVQVRQDGSTAPVGEGYVTGGGDAMRPFAGSIPFSATAERGALVFLTHSAKDGQVWQAAVLRVALGSGTTVTPAVCQVPAGEQPGAGEMTVTAYYTCDPEGRAVPAPEPVSRVVPASSGVLRASLTALLAGPTAVETDAGLSSFFSSATAGLLRGVTLDDGRAVVDFGDLPSVIPNASSSAGSALLLSELDATVFQFSTVRTAEYRIAGSCTAFTEWLQLGGCEPRTR